jgi:hypothetical protein
MSRKVVGLHGPPLRAIAFRTTKRSNQHGRQKPSGNKKTARKQNTPLKNLARSSQALSKDQAERVKGGGDIVIRKTTDHTSPP